MWLWRQRCAWGTNAMRRELEQRFLDYACLYSTHVPVRSFKRLERMGKHEPDFYVYFAERQVGYVHRWRVACGDAVIVEHFAVGTELEGKGFGVPLVRGFATAVRRELGIRRILFREYKKRPADAKLFQRLGATFKGVVDGCEEWEWVLGGESGSRRGLF